MRQAKKEAAGSSIRKQRSSGGTPGIPGFNSTHTHTSSKEATAPQGSVIPPKSIWEKMFQCIILWAILYFKL